MDKVGIIISNYNYGEYVLDALKSAMTQTKFYKIVLVDDGSTDGSMYKILEYLNSQQVLDLESKEFCSVKEPYYTGTMEIYEYSLSISVIKIKNSGASTARNVGMWHIWNDVDYFCILDADDMMNHNKVNTMLKYMNEDEVGVVYADYVIDRGNYKKIEFKQPYSPARLYNECIVHSGALIRKKYLEKVLLKNKEIYDSKLHGPLSKGFIGCTEDYDLWVRLSNECLMVHVPEILTVVRETGENQSKKMTPEIFQKNMQIINNRT